MWGIISYLQDIRIWTIVGVFKNIHTGQEVKNHPLEER